MTEPAYKIEDLSPEERLRLLDRIWESPRAHPDQLPLTNAQRDELSRRLDELDRGDTQQSHLFYRPAPPPRCEMCARLLAGRLGHPRESSKGWTRVLTASALSPAPAGSS